MLFKLEFFLVTIISRGLWSPCLSDPNLCEQWSLVGNGNDNITQERKDDIKS